MTQSDNPNIAYKYNSQRWKRLRKLKRELDPFCERCKNKGKFVAAKIIHHKEYITAENYEDDNVFFNLDNLESLCLVFPPSFFCNRTRSIQTFTNFFNNTFPFAQFYNIIPIRYALIQYFWTCFLMFLWIEFWMSLYSIYNCTNLGIV